MREGRRAIDLRMRNDMRSPLGGSDGRAAGAKEFLPARDFLVRKPHVLECERTDGRDILQMGNRVGAQAHRAAMLAIGGYGRGLMTENLEREGFEPARLGRGNEGDNLVVDGEHYFLGDLKRIPRSIV